MPAGTPADVDRAVAAARAAFRLVGRHSRRTLRPPRPAAHGAQRPRRRPRPHHRGGAGRAAQARHPGAGRAAVDSAARPRRARRPRTGRGEHRQLAGRPRADRRGRRDHPVELPAAPGGGEARARAGRRLHGGAQAQRADPADRVPALRRGRRGRAAAGGAQPGPRHRAGGRRGASPAHPDVDMVSFTGSTATGARIIAARRRPDRPGRAGAGRQVGQRDPRRRRPGHRGQGGRRQRPAQLRPDLHRVDPDAGAPRPVRRGARPRRHGRGRLPTRRPVRPGAPGSARWSPPPSASGYAATSTGAWPTAPGWSPAGPTPRCRTGGTSSRRPSSPTSHPDSAIAQEEVFGPVLVVIPFADDDEAVAIANNSRYGLAGAVWSARHRRGARGGPADAHRRGRHQRCPVQPARPVRRLQAVRPGPGVGRARAGRVLRD